MITTCEAVPLIACNGSLFHSSLKMPKNDSKVQAGLNVTELDENKVVANFHDRPYKHDKGRIQSDQSSKAQIWVWIHH